MKRWEFVSRSYEIRPGTVITAVVRSVDGSEATYIGRFRPSSTEPYVLRIQTANKSIVRVAYPRIISIKEEV